jgi:endo-1,4-beta-xylanase
MMKDMKRACFFGLILLVLKGAISIYGQSLPVTVEAESGTQGSGFRLVDTLGTRAVTIKSSSTGTSPGINRVITYEVTFPEAGTYDLYARILVGPGNYSDDSWVYAKTFGVKDATVDSVWAFCNGLVPNGYTMVTSIVDGGGSVSGNVWKWINISKFYGGAPSVNFTVDAGNLTQTFQIGGRETGFYIDKLVFGRSDNYFTVTNLNNGQPGMSELPGPGTPLADGQEKFLGCEWDYGQALNFESYWNQITPGNAGKWGSVEYTRDVMNWSVLDSTYNVARRNKFPFKLHTLIWGAQQPSWMATLDSTAQRQEIEEWYAALAARYDSFAYIDVVNEPLHNAPNGMLPWGSTTPNINYAKALGGAGATGWDWVITSFRLARQYFPKSKLILNEYSVINSTNTTQQYIALINLLKAENLIDGIGEQAHAFTTYGVSASTLKANLDLLAATDLPIYLTELDVDGTTDLPQLREYQRIFPLFWEHPGIMGITLWGFRYPVWRNDEGAYLVTEEGLERTAFTWLKAYVNDTITLTQSIDVISHLDADSIFIDETLQLEAIVLPANTTIPNISWSLVQTNLATINQNGLLDPLATGKVTVKATAWDGSGKLGTKDIWIINRSVDSIAVSSFGDIDTIGINESLQMQALVLPSNATNKAVNWSVSPAELASINTEGILTGIAAGRVTVTAAAADGSVAMDTIDVNIVFYYADSISVSSADDQDTIDVDDQLQMNATVFPAYASEPGITWSVTPGALAEISESGLLTTITAGEITVTATSTDGSGVNSSKDIFIRTTVGINDHLQSHSITAYPNPAPGGKFTINTTADITRIEVMNLHGKKIFETAELKQVSREIQLNVAPGIYLIRFSSGKQTFYEKLLVE